jgi:hypothetical protein
MRELSAKLTEGEKNYSFLLPLSQKSKIFATSPDKGRLRGAEQD